MMNLNSIKTIEPATGVLGSCISDDGATAYAACFSGEVLQISLDSGESETIGKHTSYASGARVREQAKQLVTAGYDGTLNWFDLESKQQIRSIAAHSFWSWDMALSEDERWVASASGQYLAGGYKYEPATSETPNVKVFDAESGKQKWAFAMTPSVQAVAISPDSRWIAAGNLMGEVSVWSMESGRQVAHVKTDDFTSWGVIKSHCYIGGVFALVFSRDNSSLYAAGMGPMRDPMAGNGKQRWHRYQIDGLDANAKSTVPLERVGQSKDDQCGEGLMETLAMHPSGDHFVMAGRLRGGQWNAGFFKHDDGERLHHLNTKFRITSAGYDKAGKRLLLGGLVRQPNPNSKKAGAFGRLALYEIA